MSYTTYYGNKYLALSTCIITQKHCRRILLETLSLGEKITIYRSRKNLSKKQLGEITGIHWSTISKYEHNHILPSVAAIRKIALVLKIPTDCLILDNYQPPYYFNDQEILELAKDIDLLLDQDKTFIKDTIRNYIKAHFKKPESNTVS